MQPANAWQVKRPTPHWSCTSPTPPPSQHPTPSHSLDTLAIRWKPKNFWGEWGLGFGLGVWVQFQLERFGSVRRAFECFPPERKLKWRNLIKPHTHTHPHPPTPTHTHWAVHGKSFNYVRRRLYRGGEGWNLELWTRIKLRLWGQRVDFPFVPFVCQSCTTWDAVAVATIIIYPVVMAI